MMPFAIFFLFACSGGTGGKVADQPADTTSKKPIGAISSYYLPYDLKNPSQKFKMPDALQEISGIDVLQKSKLVCVQDEKGVIYEYDLKKEEVRHSIEFAKKGDYEGVANVNDTIYVLESNGNIFRVIHLNTDSQKTKEFNTSLDKDNDTEGLCYDKKNRRLLIACKKKAGSDMKNVRAIYSFNLSTHEVDEKPAYVISLDAIKSFVSKENPAKFIGQELKDLADPKKGDVSFQPSELAIHPVTGDIYVIATVGKLLLVMNSDGKIVSINELDPGIYKQPEGITFMEDGTMFISDEGRDGHGNILKFNYQPNEK